MRSQKAIVVDTEHFGSLLRQARLNAGRSLEEISRSTKIPTPTLERLERGDVAALPADVFVCGFLRAYAREVGLDGEESVARYRRVAKSPESPWARQVIEGGKDAYAEPVGQVVAAAQALADGKLVAPAVADAPNTPNTLDDMIGKLTARVPMLEGALGRGPTFALVVLLVVLVATITLSLLLGGDPRPGRGLS